MNRWVLDRQISGSRLLSPRYADTEKILEKEVRVGFEEWELSGALSMPKEASGVPAVVLVAG